MLLLLGTISRMRFFRGATNGGGSRCHQAGERPVCRVHRDHCHTRRLHEQLRHVGRHGAPPPSPGATPVVAACDPSSGNPKDQLVVAVTGSNFVAGATVPFGERVTVQNVVFHSDTQLDMTIKVHSKASAGPRDVSVTNLDAQAGIGVSCFVVN